MEKSQYLKQLVVKLLMLIPLVSLAQEKEVKGFISNGAEPIEGVHIFVRGTDVGTYSDDEGKYRLTVNANDALTYTYQEKEVYYIDLTTYTGNFDVIIDSATTELDEITLTDNKYRQRSQNKLLDDYNVDKDIIKTKYVAVDKKVSGVAMEIRQGDQVNLSAPNILGALQSMFTGVKISPKGMPTMTTSPDSQGAVIYLRGAGSIKHPIEASYDVDGMVYTEPPLFLDLANIERVAKIPGLAGTTLYGSVGAGGVFIINTKSGNTAPTAEQLEYRLRRAQKKKYDIATVSLKRQNSGLPTYVKRLKESKELDKAVGVYNEFKKMYGGSAAFYLSALDFFATNYAESDFVNQVLSDSEPLIEDSIVLKRAAAMIFAQSENFENTKEQYLSILKQWPRSPQSYLDLAQVLIQMDKPQQALNIINRYYLLIEQDHISLEKEGSHPIFGNELNKLIAELDIKDGEKQPSVNNKGATRIVLEWNDHTANFAFHFVDPQKNFYIWENDFDDENLSYNYPSKPVSKEYFIPENAMSGNWNVNLDYFGNASNTPTYVKATVYFNYGLPEEYQEESLIRCSLKNKTLEFLKITTGNSMVLR